MWGKVSNPKRSAVPARNSITPHVSNTQSWEAGVAHFLQISSNEDVTATQGNQNQMFCLPLTSLIYWLPATVLLRKGNWSQFSPGTKSAHPCKNRRAPSPAGTRGQSRGQKPQPFPLPAGQQQLACRHQLSSLHRQQEQTFPLLSSLCWIVYNWLVRKR